jgi:nucleoside-diphosphate-sugar epimerase
MRVLVTGSNGLIGRELCARLKEKSMEIREFDLALGKNLLNKKDCEEAVKGIHAIVHLAALLDESAGKEKLFEANVQGTKNLLEAAVAARVPRLVFLSTVGVMGNISSKANEETKIAPVTAYEQSKAEAEKLVQSYQETIAATILRAALVLGPNEYWKNIFKIIKKDFPLIGDGKQKWQTIYYKDLVNAILFVLEREQTEQETFIVAGEETPSLLELVELIKAEINLKTKTKNIPVWQGKMLGAIYGIIAALQGKKNFLSQAHIERLSRNREYDLTKIHAYGWQSKVPLNIAVKETIQALEKK